ncbi:hypothetical protein R69749_06951 [Paraburkholderia domus]|nr:hypothetical protein R69619_06920 [Paraburkholderia nemoris]CAE6879538.1 hypothetical protein R69749_06951 [Paraburkholderia domus]
MQTNHEEFSKIARCSWPIQWDVPVTRPSGGHENSAKDSTAVGRRRRGDVDRLGSATVFTLVEPSRRLRSHSARQTDTRAGVPVNASSSRPSSSGRLTPPAVLRTNVDFHRILTSLVELLVSRERLSVLPPVDSTAEAEISRHLHDLRRSFKRLLFNSVECLLRGVRTADPQSGIEVHFQHESAARDLPGFECAVRRCRIGNGEHTGNRGPKYPLLRKLRDRE